MRAAPTGDEPAVHVEHVAGDKARFREITHGGEDVGDIADTLLEREPSEYRLVCARGERRTNETGRHGIDANAVGGELRGERNRQGMHAALGNERRRGRDPSDTVVHQDCADIDDAAAARCDRHGANRGLRS